MQQTARLAAPVLLRHARRSLLLLGAAFVWWLLFSGGPAHADDARPAEPQTAVSDVAHSLQQAPGALVDQSTAATSSTLRTAPKRVTGTLTEATRTAPEPVRTLVDSLSTTLEPTLTATTTAVADTVDRTAQTVQAALDAADPQSTQAITATPQRVDAPHALRHHRIPAAAAPVTTSGTVVAGQAAADGSADRAGSPTHGRPGVPAVPVAPSAPALPGGPDNAPAGPMAALGGLLLAPPALRRLRRGWERAALLLDPVYPPGCSPD